MKEDPKHIRISEFNYPLPDERIAKFPLPVRDQSKLLLYRHGEVTEDIFTSLPDYLPANSLMIFNNTKVIQARLHFHKETGALIEVFCLEPVQPNDYAPQLPANGACRMALHDRQSEEMERRCAQTGNNRERKAAYPDRRTRGVPWNQPLGGFPLEQSGNNIRRYSRSVRRTTHPSLSEPGDAGVIRRLTRPFIPR